MCFSEGEPPTRVPPSTAQGVSLPDLPLSIFRYPVNGPVGGRFSRFALVVLVWLAAYVCTALAAPHIYGKTFAFFWVAVLFAAWSEGLAVAIVVALAAVSSTYFQLPDGLSSRGVMIESFVTLAMFMLASTLVSMLTARVSMTTTRLRASEGQFRTLAEVAPVGILIASPTLDSVYANPRAVEITGLEGLAITVASWRQLMHPEDREVAFAAHAAFRNGLVEDSTSEFRIVRADGDTRWIRTMSRWVRGESDSYLAMVLTLDDITRERQLESQLQHAQKTEAIGQLAGGIAHDFNNLLTVITGNLEFLRDELPPQHPAQQDLQHISGAAERARLLVRQLLAFGRKQMLKPREVDLGIAIRQAERWFRRVLGDEITCRVHITPGQDLRVHADPSQLDQVLLNLAVNARDAMLTSAHGREGTGGELRFEADRVTLTGEDVALWSPLSAGEYVRLRASDTGHGMDEATRSRAFEPFFTTKDVGAGSGLGLATVEGIVAQSDGAIRVDSRAGLGTTFTMLLPVVLTAQEPDEVGDELSAEARAAVQGVVLVVEEDRTVRRTTRRMLVRAGYAVEEAEHGVEALQQWGDRTAHLAALVTDIRMAHMNGLELARTMRLRAPDLPVVYVSGFNDELDRLHSVYDVFLEKPFTREALLEAIERARTGRVV